MEKNVTQFRVRRRILFVFAIGMLLGQTKVSIAQAKTTENEYLFNDSHFHLTNYIQEGISINKFLEIMSSKVQRSTLFGIPLHQQWSYKNSGKFAPTYYLESDAPLYYYSFTDAFIAMQYKSLNKEQQNRLDPMITGFNPTDMYAAKHIERVLKTFPGVFSGIGEFSVHKEFVSPKVAGEVASLTNPALDSILDFAGKVGLVVILHNDIDMPISKGKFAPLYLDEIKELFRRHPQTKIIWAHIGLGRIVHPVSYHSSSAERPVTQIEVVEQILKDPELSHVNFDISWDEVAKYIVASPQTIAASAELMNRFPDRFLFGTDVVSPPDQKFYMEVHESYKPLWKALKPETSEKIRKGNYIRLFDEARRRVRAWELENVTN